MELTNATRGGATLPTGRSLRLVVVRAHAAIVIGVLGGIGLGASFGRFDVISSIASLYGAPGILLGILLCQRKPQHGRFLARYIGGFRELGRTLVGDRPHLLSALPGGWSHRYRRGAWGWHGGPRLRGYDCRGLPVHARKPSVSTLVS